MYQYCKGLNIELTVVDCFKKFEGYIQADKLCTQFRALICTCDFLGVQKNIPQWYMHLDGRTWGPDAEQENTCMTKHPQCLSTY